MVAIKPRTYRLRWMLTESGLLSPRLRRRITSRLSNVWRSFHPSFPSPSALDARTDTMTSSPHTSAQPSPSTTLEISYLGTGTSPMHMRRHCAMSVATRATSPITTGQNGPMTQQSRLCLMGRRHPLVATVYSVARTRQSMVFQRTLPR